MSIRWRLFASYLLVVLAAVLILGPFVARAMEDRHLATLQASLLSQANLIGEMTEGEFSRPVSAPGMDDRVRRLDRETGLRVTLIRPDGTVLADSESPAATMENHGRRPEVQAALAQGHGADLRRSATLHVDFLYVSSRVRRGETPLGVVRLAVPLHQVQAARGQIRRLVLTFALIGIGLALLLSLQFARRLTTSIRELERAARSFAQGKLEARARPRGRDELTVLAEQFNAMATQLRQILEESQAETRKVETILAHLGEAVLVTDAKGLLTLCNLSAERAFGVRADQVLGHTVADATQSHALDAAFREALAKGRVVATEVQLLFPKTCLLEATVTSFASEARAGAVAVLHDVTELRRLESVRREFVSNASHELRTPVTAIRAMAETLASGGQEDPVLLSRLLPELERHAERLSTLVTDLLDLSTVESGRVPLEQSEVKVQEAVRTVVSELASLAQTRGFVIESEVAEGLRAAADWSALNRVLANLLDNAIKYTDPGGRLGVQASLHDDTVIITVWDTGIGLASTDLPHIFERFYRVDKARSLRVGGTGLGLSIVKHLTESMGGSVSVESELGRGSRFTITLPAA